MGIVRLLLACSVLYWHSSSYFGLELLPGRMAVEMFFIVSGFYMSMIASGKYDMATWAGRRRFYASRFWRLWPTFIITTAAIYAWWLAAYAFLGRAPESSGAFREVIGNELIYRAVQFSNVFMIGQDVLSHFHVSPSQGLQLTFGPPDSIGSTLWMGYMRTIGPAWSIGTEIWFYLLLPFLCRLSSAWLVLAAVASLVLRAGMDAHGLETYFFFPAQLALFLVGMLAQRHMRVTPRASRPMAIGGLAVLALASLAFGSVLRLDQGFRWALYAVFALTLPAMFAYHSRSSLDRTIGELSYPVYITHGFIMALLVTIGRRTGLAIGAEAILVVTVAVSAALYILVDKPVGRWRGRFARAATLSEGLVAAGPVQRARA